MQILFIDKTNAGCQLHVAAYLNRCEKLYLIYLCDNRQHVIEKSWSAEPAYLVAVFKDKPPEDLVA